MKEWVIVLAFVYKALETFCQAFIAYICLNIIVAAVGVDYTNEITVKIALIGLCIPALIAVIATVINIKKMMPIIKKINLLYQ